MPRLKRKTVILLKTETTAGVDAVPTGAANALQVMDFDITPLDANNIDLNLLLPWFGNSPSLVGTASVKCSFSVPLAGSATAATAPAWGPLLIGCANAETTGLTTPNRVEYLPATDLIKTSTIYYYDDGVLHKLLGCFGNMKLSAKSGEAPKLQFDFVGIDGGMTAVANAVATLTNWKLPVGITKANVTDVLLGCTYTAGALAGGTSYNSTGLTADWGNKVSFGPMLSVEQVILSDRAMVGTLQIELSAAQEVAMMASVKANTVQGLGFVLGTATGNKIMLHAPAVQMLNPKKDEVNGMRVISYDLKFNPVAGNDEFRIIHL